MILPSPSETSKPGLPIVNADTPPSSAGLPPPPPCHPSLHFGRSSSPIPPKYDVLTRPISTIVYNFGPSLSPLDQNSMLLYAPHAMVANQKGGNEYSINDILTSYTKFFKNSWTWKTVTRNDKLVTLTWDDNAGGGAISVSNQARLRVGHSNFR
ncbi:hypothetical protein CPB85DRAFT_17612 [Mucidula mucida]|nr:hypothetical protein CPB85DRAFT_17612 [Mucidula mucida]